MSKEFKPNFKTPEDELCKEEINKLAGYGYIGNLGEAIKSKEEEMPWEAEQLAKSHGIYMQFNRAKKGNPKEWVYMVRIAIPGGGPISPEQWRIFHDLSEKYTKHELSQPSIRLTTRQSIQFHWIKKKDLKSLIKDIAKSGFSTLNGCGDNVRNVMSCPLGSFSSDFSSNEMAREIGAYFRLDEEPFIKIFEVNPQDLRKDGEPEERYSYGPRLLNRKFKIGISSAIRNPETGNLEADNCVELLTHDLGIAPLIKGDVVVGMQLYIGGGQGEKNGKLTAAMFAKPLCQVCKEELMEVLHAVVKVHEEWGDRQNRHWARLKYVVFEKGIEWYREKVEEKIGRKLLLPNVDLDIGCRELHHGWIKQPDSNLWAFGAYIECGRLIDDIPNGRLKSMVIHLMEEFSLSVIITPNQDLMFIGIEESKKDDFERSLKTYGWGKRNGSEYSSLRMHSGACVGRDTCRLTYTDSEKFEPKLIDELERRGWRELAESIGITGCERQCFRPSTKSIGLIGTGLNLYQLRLFGSKDGRHQGCPLVSSDGGEMYLKRIPRDRVADVIDLLFSLYKKDSRNSEDFGSFCRRLGPDGIIHYLKGNEVTADLMKREDKTNTLLIT